MRRAFSFLFCFLFLMASWSASGQTPSNSSDQSTGPLRVVVAGLVHGHAEGFFRQIKDRQDIRVVGISEPDRALFERYAQKYGLDQGLWHADLEEMLGKIHPQAVL